MIEIVWFDSLGAKSSCILVETDRRILIDPGIAVMHPGFPAPKDAKVAWYEEGRKRIKLAARNADVVIISHYHYDHFTDFDREIYEGKVVLAKNPNEYINDSQRKRAEKFFENLFKAFGGDLNGMLLDPIEKSYELPELASFSKEFGDYQKRRLELLEKGFKWFKSRARKWSKLKRIPEAELEGVKLKFADGRSFKFGRTKIRFSEPLFHGIEFSRLGWVVATVVEYEGVKLIHSSDINGPVIEDYAEWIIEENPDFLVLDGPMTYMLGYTLNLINFRRTLENAVRIVEEVEAELIIYDHHLPREPRFKERTKVVWETARKLGRKVLTAAEYLGKEPAVFRFSK